MTSPPDRRRALALTADCANCFGLCCVALPFAASRDFADDKPAGEPCRNLDTDDRCRIHAQLRDRGFPGCVAFDCFGAGQHVSQGTFGGTSWRSAPGTSRQMFEVFGVMRQLHELLYLLDEAATRSSPPETVAALQRTRSEVERTSEGTAEQVLAADVPALRAQVGELLREVSTRVRRLVRRQPSDLRGADLVGARRRGADLRAADLRGALLVAADLRGADLRSADLLGADLRGTRLDAADLTGALFLLQSQLDAARGSATTRLPEQLRRPAHWSR